MKPTWNTRTRTATNQSFEVLLNSLLFFRKLPRLQIVVLVAFWGYSKIKNIYTCNEHLKISFQLLQPHCFLTARLFCITIDQLRKILSIDKLISYVNMSRKHVFALLKVSKVMAMLLNVY